MKELIKKYNKKASELRYVISSSEKYDERLINTAISEVLIYDEIISDLIKLLPKNKQLVNI